ncbi:MAG: TIGR04255 family protein [Nitrospira sp.]|nr:TIGR04255 family protein [Nitrospira sp.]
MINLAETFEHFPQAPAIEAVLDIRARATVDLTEQRLREAAQRNLPTYEFLDSQREIKHEVRFSTTQGEEIQQGLQDLGWKGMRFRSTDRRHIVNIHRDGMIFSRLSPYQDWDQFQEEGLRLWDFSTHLTKPETISRIGVRFINQILLPQGEVNFESYMTSPPSPPENMSMPFLGFMHQGIFQVPESPYSIMITKTIQSPSPTTNNRFALILDTDVFTNLPRPTTTAGLEACLKDMRWLKNKAFFGTITEKAKELFR